MAFCNCLDEILRGCDNNAGGLKHFYAFPLDEVTSITATASGEIFSIVLGTASCPDPKFVEYQFTKNSSSFVEDAAIDLTNGSTYYTVSTSLVITRRDLDKRNALALAASGQQDLLIILEDGNGIFWLQGQINGANLTQQGEGSGVAKADGSKYSVTFLSEELEQMPTIDSSIIAALIA
jgi:hypothetical protein